MGSPDYPGEEDHTFNLPPGQSLPMHGIHNSDEEADSDDSMPPTFQQPENPNDSDDPYNYAGYQPLSFEPMAADDSSSSDDSDDENDTEVDFQAIAGSESIVETTAEREILREVWNAPRPAELDIELDTIKAEEIKSVMSTVSLGLSTITPPDWAVNVPESKWIEELLQEVRKNRSSANNTGSAEK